MENLEIKNCELDNLRNQINEIDKNIHKRPKPKKKDE